MPNKQAIREEAYQASLDRKTRLDIISRFKPADNTYTTLTGHALTFRAVSAGLVDRAQQYYEGYFLKPEMPIMTVDHGKGRTSEAANPNDPAYTTFLDEWNARVLRALNMWLFAVGIVIDVPKTPEKGSLFEASLKLELDDVDEDIRKYLYISSLINTDEFTFLGEAIIGKASVTQEGLRQAAEDFPSQG